MSDYIFIMLRHVNNKTANADEIWKECYKSIRLFYDQKIIIIDNNSDYNMIKNDLELVNCEVYNNPNYENVLYSPFNFLLNFDFRRAVIIHDGVIFQKFVDFSLFQKVKFIWHFDIKDTNHYPLIRNQFSLLENNSDLFTTLSKEQWAGCLGCCMAIEKDFLMEIENKYKISILKDHIKNMNPDSVMFERSLGIICYTLFPDIINDLSYEGEIQNMIWGHRYSHYLEKKIIFNQHNWKTGQYEDIDISSKSIIKIFGARL